MSEPQTPIKVLAIDNAPKRQEAYRHFLEQAGPGRFTLVPAETGEKGLSLSRTFRPHCVILSCTLPDTDSSRVLSTMNGKASPPTAVVMVADSAGEGAALQALKAGAQDYVLFDKLTPGQLVRSAGNAMEMVRLRIELARARHELASSDLKDPQTSLASRNLFFDRMTHAVILAKRNNQNVGLIMIELNGLKEINLVKGHETGDAAIVEIAKRLSATLREADTVARFDGAKFAIILQTGATYEGAVITAQKILHVMEEPLEIGSGAVELNLNIGISLFPNHGEDGDTLIHHADTAMAQSRAQGGGYTMFTFDDLLVDFLQDGDVA